MKSLGRRLQRLEAIVCQAAEITPEGYASAALLLGAYDASVHIEELETNARQAEAQGALGHVKYSGDFFCWLREHLAGMSQSGAFAAERLEEAEAAVESYCRRWSLSHSETRQDAIELFLMGEEFVDRLEVAATHPYDRWLEMVERQSTTEEEHMGLEMWRRRVEWVRETKARLGIPSSGQKPPQGTVRQTVPGCNTASVVHGEADGGR